MEDGSFLRMNLKMTLSGRGPGHLTQFRNFGTLYNWQNIKGNCMYINNNRTADIKGKN